jgi:Putative zinc-finger
MCDKERLVAYVYDEMSADERSQFERHLRECGECRGEAADLRGARVQLAAWTPPELDVDFQIVRHARPGWRAWWSPAWGFAAAAVLVFAVAAAIANVQVRYDRDGVTLRTGWHDAPPATAAVTQTASAPDAALAARYAEMERRVRQLESAAARPAPAPASMTAVTGLSDADLRRVRDLVVQSEARQQREIAIRVAQVMADVNRQRQADLAVISSNLERLQAQNVSEQAQHRQAMWRLAQQR